MFCCEQCNFKSKQKYDLIRHIAAVHNKEKPFACSKCNHKCSLQQNLKKHIAAVHNKEKPFACTRCKFKCSQKMQLQRHITTVHNKEKPFTCPECNFKCSQKNAMKIHINYKHKKMTTRRVEPNAYCQHNRLKRTCKECNPVGHRAQLIRAAIKRGMKINGVSKDKRSEAILSCTFKEFEAFLQTKIAHWNRSFGFILNNPLQGDLELDHIKPISLAKTKEEVEQLSHFTNFQLIWKDMNQEKRAKWSDIDEKFWQESIYLNPDHYNLYVPNEMWSNIYSLY